MEETRLHQGTPIRLTKKLVEFWGPDYNQGTRGEYKGFINGEHHLILENKVTWRSISPKKENPLPEETHYIGSAELGKRVTMYAGEGREATGTVTKVYENKQVDIEFLLRPQIIVDRDCFEVIPREETRANS